MKVKEIAEGYDTIAEVWSSPSFDHRNGIAQHERALAFCEHQGHALDIGCGSSGRIIDLLLGQGFNIEGVDVSPRMVELARERHSDTVFHCADVCDWPLPRQYDFISAWDSIWHVPLSEHEGVLRKMLEHLNPGGVCIFSMGGLDHEAEKTDSAMGPKMYYSTLGIPKALQVVSEASCICRHLEFDQYPEPHVYLIVQRE